MQTTRSTQTGRTQGAQDEAVPLRPLSPGVPFSLTGFRSASPVLGFARQGDVIVECDGVFSISGMVETSYIKLDTSFKQLVDSVLL